MRIRTILIATLAALIAAAVGVASSGAASSQTAVAQASSVRHGIVIVRGPRGYRGYRGFRGPRGPTGPQGPTGAQGPAGTDHVSSFSINWRGDSNAAGNSSASVGIPGIGTLNVVCSPSQQTASLTPAASGSVRTEANISDFEGSASSNQMPYSQNGQAIPIGSPTQPGQALPPNGMLTGTLSVQPVDGTGGPEPAPATLTLSSEYVVNNPPNDSCFIAGQVTQGG